jgi:hypothetical protein
MMLSRYFSLDEMLISQEAVRKGISMTPDSEIKSNLRALCFNVLDPLRLQVDVPIFVSSGYRPPVLNRMIGGAATSQHCKGEAADIHVHGMTPLQVANLIASMKLPYDQLIMEFGQWVHVSHKRTGPQRMMQLTAHRVDGVAHYFPGLHE